MKLFLLFVLAQILKNSAQTIESKIVSNESIGNNDVSPCVTKIIKNFYTYQTIVTFVDINFPEGENILKNLSQLYHVGIKSRNTANLQNSTGDGFIIAAANVLKFVYEFPNLEREPDWCPQKKFFIIIDKLAPADLLLIFHTLLKSCIYNAIVIDNARDPILYTYNPFENYACGKKFDRIIKMGNCLDPIHDIFYNKFVTGLRNCTFRANSAHWPPYSIDPVIAKSRGKVIPGVEEFIIQIIGEREQFNIVHYNYSNDAEIFSTVSKNLSAIGPLMVIQERKDDMMFGGMLLTNSRATVFDFIWVHLPYVDDVRILVKAATQVDYWRNSYLEFSLAVWLLLISAFVAYYGLLLLLIRPNDKGVIFFKMCDYFFQHGSRIPVNCNIRCVFIFWIWFASLMNSIYQSSLVGLITNPSKNYQVANEKDIQQFSLKPCISPLMSKYFFSVEEDLYIDNHGNNDQCDNLLESIRTVSKSENLYTYTLYAVYSYYKFNFYDDYGKSEIYAFKNPTNKVIYAIYLYKGFPMLERLQALSLRLRENGMTTHYFNALLAEQKKSFYFKKPLRKSKVIVPWYILITGSTISTVVFIIELNRKPKRPVDKGLITVIH